MVLKLRIISRPLVFAGALATICTFNISPGLSATLAQSSAKFKLENFNRNPLDILTFTKANTYAYASQGLVNANATADASFFVDPNPQLTQGNNSTWSHTKGTGSNYLGMAQSVAEIIGYQFSIAGGETFSFDWSSSLNLQANIDNPASENATADGVISLELYDSKTWQRLDYLGEISHADTANSADSLKRSFSDNFHLQSQNENLNLGGNNESINSYTQGHFSRYFDEPMQVTLVEIKANRARVKAPEGSSSWALFPFALLGLFATARAKNKGRSL